MALHQIPIAYIDIRFFAHATEDENKVVQAAQRVLPSEYAQDVLFKRSSLKGHYNNPILHFDTRIKRKEVVTAFVDNLSKGLGQLDKDTLLREIELHVEKGSLYIRLDKQAAFQGNLKLCSADPIRVRLRFRKKKLEDIVEVCREMGVLS